MSNHSLFADMDATASDACVGLIEEWGACRCGGGNNRCFSGFVEHWHRTWHKSNELCM